MTENPHPPYEFVNEKNHVFCRLIVPRCIFQEKIGVLKHSVTICNRRFFETQSCMQLSVAFDHHDLQHEWLHKRMSTAERSESQLGGASPYHLTVRQFWIWRLSIDRTFLFCLKQNTRTSFLISTWLRGMAIGQSTRLFDHSRECREKWLSAFQGNSPSC